MKMAQMNDKVTVVVTDLYKDRVIGSFTGDKAEVLPQLLERFPWAGRADASFDGVVAAIARAQAFKVEVE